MSLRLFMAVVVVLLGLSGAGCTMVSTEQPLYGEKDKVNDVALEGEWVPVGHNGGRTDKVKIERDEQGRYSIEGNFPDVDGVYETVLFKLGPHYMIEMGKLDRYQRQQKNERHFGKIAMIEGRIFVAMPNGENIWSLLKQDPTLLKHQAIVRGKNGDPFSWLTLTDSTENIRAFILKHGHAFFLYPLEAYRRPKDAKVPVSTVLQTKEQQTFEVMWLMWAHLRAIGYGGMTARTGVKELDRGLDAGETFELLPELELPESACDPRVGKLYREVRAAIVAVDISAAKEAKPGEDKPEKEKEDAEKRLARINAYFKDPLGARAGYLPKEHPQREVLERLAKELDEVTVEMEKKYDVRWR